MSLIGVQYDLETCRAELARIRERLSDREGLAKVVIAAFGESPLVRERDGKSMGRFCKMAESAAERILDAVRKHVLEEQ